MKKLLMATALFLLTSNAFSAIVNGKPGASYCGDEPGCLTLLTTFSLPTVIIDDVEDMDTGEAIAMLIQEDEEMVALHAARLDVTESQVIDAIESLINSEDDITIENLNSHL